MPRIQRDPIDRLLFKSARETVADIRKRAEGNTAYACLICAQPIKRSESYQSWRGGWAHERCKKILKPVCNPFDVLILGKIMTKRNSKIPTHFRILARLCEPAHTNDSLDELAHHFKLSKTTIRYQLHSLRREGYIEYRDRAWRTRRVVVPLVVVSYKS